MKKIVRWYKRYRLRDFSTTKTHFSSGINIYNWKIISVGHIYSRDVNGLVEGLFIHCSVSVIFLPGLTLTRLIKFLYSEEEVMEQFFLYTPYYELYRCYRCKGSGKLDWISKLTISKEAPYIRDTEWVYLYENPGKMPYKKHDICFSKSILEEGDICCPNCKGTGLTLDARFKLLRRMPQVKSLLKKYRTTEVFAQIILEENFEGGTNGNF